MTESLLSQIQYICKTYHISLERNKGQNFLTDANVLTDILVAADIQRQDTILEIGPGVGVLTEGLLERAGTVVSVELDQKLFDFLKMRFHDAQNLRLVHEDILRVALDRLLPEQYAVVANIPYNITSVLLRKLLTGTLRPHAMTLLVQKEVAERICAPVGDLSMLAISVQLYGQPKIIRTVSKNCFWPKPQVDSAILKIDKIKTKGEVDNFLHGVSEEKLWRLIKIGFSARRKQLQNNLAAGLKISADDAKKMLNKANLDSKIRAQNLSIGEWITLAKVAKNQPDTH